MLENFLSYIRSKSIENHHILLEQLKQRTYYKPQGRPLYSAEMIRFALHLRYTSLQAYKLLLDKFPLPSMSLLNKIQLGGVNISPLSCNTFSAFNESTPPCWILFSSDIDGNGNLSNESL